MRIEFANVQVSVLNSSQYVLPVLIVTCIIPLQKQHNYSDCGLFAITNAFAHCTEQKPECLNYDFSIMRRHFAGCLEDKLIRHFPANPRSVRKMTRRSEEVAVFYTCRMPEDEEKMTDVTLAKSDIMNGAHHTSQKKFGLTRTISGTVVTANRDWLG